MGRHARRGTAERSDTGSVPGAPQTGPAPGPGSGRRRRPAAPEAAHGGGRAEAPLDAPADGARPHPEQREQGGAWGDFGARAYAPPPSTAPPRVPGPRKEYVEAFDQFHAYDGAGADADPDDVFAAGAPPRRPSAPAGPAPDPYGAVTDWDHGVDDDELRDTEDELPGAERAGGTKGRTFTGIAAAAVTTVLAVVVAGQVADGREGVPNAAATDTGSEARAQTGSTSRSDDRPPPQKPAPMTYGQKMGKKYPLAADLKASGEFEAIGGFDKAPGRGQKFRYRVDVEKGLGLDGELFAQAVQKTLNDDRSWAHGGGRTFERISSGSPDFVITLASPGTTAVWCAKSGLDTTQDNVSCDSAATERVMVNAYRWAQGAETYGDAIHAYRQMLINHEVGHRIGFNHVMCTKEGALAPVMQQQTKFLEHDGITCRPNPWAFPGN